MTNEIPLIARMLIIKDTINQKKEIKKDISYNTPKYDSECEYCLNTTAWD